MSLSLRSIYAMEPEAANGFLRSIRWSERGGKPDCPRCKCESVYELKARQLTKCQCCGHQFSVTSGTYLAARKMKPTDIIAMSFVFASGAKGMSSIQMANTIGVTQKTAWKFCGLVREVMESEVDKLSLSGVVEIDGATFGGHRKHANMARAPGEKRWSVKHTEQRRVIVVAKARFGRTVPFVGGKESDALADIARVVQPGSIIQADGARAWDNLARLFDMMRIEHSYAFSANSACTNNAESYFSRMRRSHSGTHHKIHGKYLRRYACEMAWRSDFKDLTVEERTIAILKMLLSSKNVEVNEKVSEAA